MKLFSRNTLRPIVLAASPFVCLTFPVSACASPASEALLQLAAQTSAAREVSLADLGFADTPVVLDEKNPHRAFYIPVSEGVNILDASIDVHGVYHKSDQVQAGVVLSVDDKPQALDMAHAPSGQINQTVAVSSGVRTNPHVRLDVDWEATPVQGGDGSARSDAAAPEGPSASSAPDAPTAPSVANSVDPAALQCPPLSKNRLTVAPDTVLRYRYDTRSVTTAKMAWDMLPKRPVLLVAGKPISRPGFDTAWRVGVLLGQLGRSARVKSLPVLGDTVDVTGVTVPAALAPFPAYGSLQGHAQVTLTKPAQLGALLTLGAPAVAADMVVVDQALEQQISQSLNALKAQLESDPEAEKALAQWRAQRMALTARQSPNSAPTLATYAAQAVIAIPAGDGPQVTQAFGRTLLPWLSPGQLHGFELGANSTEASDTVKLLVPDSAPPTFLVAEKGEWHVDIPLPALSSDGQMANGIVVEVTAAPDPSGVRPVLTLFWNDVLLDAWQLKANQQPERLKTRVPPYVMGRNNEVRIAVQRAPAAAQGSSAQDSDCNGQPGGFPVTILPSSHIIKGAPEPDDTFRSLLPLLMNGPQVFVPASVTDTPQANLRTLINLAASTGLSAVQSTLVIADNAQAASPGRPFLSLGVPVQATSPDVTRSGNGPVFVNHRPASSLPDALPDALSVAQVVKSHGQYGIVWYALGPAPAELNRPFALTTGTTVILDQSGPLSWLRGDVPAELSRGPNDTAFYEWRKQWSWGAPLVLGLIVAFILLLLVAGWVRRKNEQPH